jgi:hypothetical protein
MVEDKSLAVSWSLVPPMAVEVPWQPLSPSHPPSPGKGLLQSLEALWTCLGSRLACVEAFALKC